jgi:hypothetical protein
VTYITQDSDSEKQFWVVPPLKEELDSDLKSAQESMSESKHELRSESTLSDRFDFSY